jgi:tRNA (mo5U34)-methyltransferase
MRFAADHDGGDHERQHGGNDGEGDGDRLDRVIVRPTVGTVSLVAIRNLLSRRDAASATRPFPEGWVDDATAEPAAPFSLVAGQRCADVLARAGGRNWFHSFEFVDETGERCAISGYDPTIRKAHLFGMPERLDGLTVIDVGAYDGFFSFEAARRGAADVLATDHFVWTGNWDPALENFQLVREVTGLAVRDQIIRVEELTPDAVGGQYDVVLFYGVLYHAPDPLGYLKRIRELTRGQALVETVVDLLDIDRPAMAYYPGAWLNGDGSNFFGPNLLAVEGLLRDAGFTGVEHLASWAPHLVQHIRQLPVPAGAPTSGRAVFRATV